MIDRQEFTNKYIDTSLSISDIAKLFDLSNAMVYYYGKKFNLKRIKKHHNPEWLKEKYVNENLSMREIGELAGTGPDNISLLLKKFNITKGDEKIVSSRRKTMLKRYGGDTPMTSPILLEKINSTKFEKYGTINTSSLNSVKMKLPKSVDIYGYPANYWSKKYGVPRTSTLSIYRSNCFDGVDEFISLLKNYQVKISDIENIFHKKTNIAFHNRYFDKDIYPNLKFKPDFKLSEKIALNTDGLYWHSEERTPNKLYHFNMRKEYENNGLRIFQFREDEIKNKFEIILSMINNSLGLSERRVYGRKTICKKVSNDDAQAFLNEHHLMGAISSRHIGLYYENELISVMSFKIIDQTIKVDRFCSKVNFVVIGGLSKLMKFITRTSSAKNIDYWVDLRYGTGKHLEDKGFLLEKETLGWKWTDFKETYNRLKCRANMDERNLTQAEHAEEMGWVKIYDAGQRLYRKKL